MTDLRQTHDLLLSVYAQQKQGFKGLDFGWPYLDSMTGGMRKDDLISYVGRPALGKTWQMLYGAHYGWMQAEMNPELAGSPRLFVSMEMDAVSIAQRIMSMHLSIPAFKVKNGQFTNVGPGGGTLVKYQKGLKQLQGFKAPFWIVHGKLSATVADIEALAVQLKPEAIFIDGAYLLQNPKVRNRFERVAENLDLLKRDIAPIAPTVCSWQFKRPEKKKKGKDEVQEDHDLDDIGYSDTIGQHSSLVLGLFQPDSVETIQRRRVKVLKGRNGETGEFMTNFRFDTMDFSEYVEQEIDDYHVDD